MRFGIPDGELPPRFTATEGSERVLGIRGEILPGMLRGGGIPNLTRKDAIARFITCFDGFYANWIRAPREWVVCRHDCAGRQGWKRGRSPFPTPVSFPLYCCWDSLLDEPAN